MAMAMTAVLPAFAGGFITNTNQSAAFLRMPAQEAVISVDAAYFNPASIAFLEDGFHFGFNWQVASQTRQSTTEYADGLGSFESQIAGLSALLNTYPIPGAPFMYDVDMFMNGTQYTFANQITGGVKFLVSDNIDLNLGYFQSFYDHVEKTTPSTPALKEDFYRTSKAFAAGISFRF